MTDTEDLAEQPVPAPRLIYKEFHADHELGLAQETSLYESSLFQATYILEQRTLRQHGKAEDVALVALRPTVLQNFLPHLQKIVEDADATPGVEASQIALTFPWLDQPL